MKKIGLVIVIVFVGLSVGFLGAFGGLHFWESRDIKTGNMNPVDVLDKYYVDYDSENYLTKEDGENYSAIMIWRVYQPEFYTMHIFSDNKVYFIDNYSKPLVARDRSICKNESDFELFEKMSEEILEGFKFDIYYSWSEGTVYSYMSDHMKNKKISVEYENKLKKSDIDIVNLPTLKEFINVFKSHSH